MHGQQNIEKLNHGRVTRRNKLILRNAVRYKKYHPTKKCLFCPSVVVAM